jgi:hypothetical protein
LWPTFETDAVTPVSILIKQAALLGDKTGQLVTADVFSTVGREQAAHFFQLIVPTLDNYKCELFHVEHKVEDLYPVAGYFGEGLPVSLPGQKAFLQWLKEVLTSEETLKKIDSLIAQAKG